MTDLEELTRTEKATAPPKRWLNWWFSHGPSEAPWDDGDMRNPLHDPTPYPSKDVAEAIAEKQLARLTPEKAPECLTYIGAFPEGERP